ncbi:hypothetical protein I553_6537 [Mycobacterium xenopi 4042]|uniref:Transmembrane protein n=1 Tax=Mycobacterium xenopi 4042 TaxID=1299334 RepID=X8BEX0_MYCXE|nr:hypothetical protein I553_6537 [Mycobacterium xenopi 4042]
MGRAAETTAKVAGAVGGAAVNGVVGAVTGAAAGVRRGTGTTGYAMPLAVLTLGGLGASGLVEWPLVLAVGGGALLLRQMNRPRTTRPHRRLPSARNPSRRDHRRLNGRQRSDRVTASHASNRPFFLRSTPLSNPCLCQSFCLCTRSQRESRQLRRSPAH